MECRLDGADCTRDASCLGVSSCIHCEVDGCPKVYICGDGCPANCGGQVEVCGCEGVCNCNGNCPSDGPQCGCEGVCRCDGHCGANHAICGCEGVCSCNKDGACTDYCYDSYYNCGCDYHSACTCVSDTPDCSVKSCCERDCGNCSGNWSAGCGVDGCPTNKVCPSDCTD